MSGAVRRGALIVLEGCDKCGKTTQCKKLVEALKNEGVHAELWRFPDRDTPIGRICGDYLTRKLELEDHAVHLMFAANRWETVPKMKEKLLSGTTLIVDRYSFSGVAFSAAKKTMDLEWCRKPEVGLPKPDAVLYLTVSAEEAAKRSEYGGERYEETEIQKAVAKNYQILMESDWKVVDASNSIEEVHTELKTLAKEVIESCVDKDIGQLWVPDGKCDETHMAKRFCSQDKARQPSQPRNLNGQQGDIES